LPTVEAPQLDDDDGGDWDASPQYGDVTSEVESLNQIEVRFVGPQQHLKNVILQDELVSPVGKDVQEPEFADWRNELVLEDDVLQMLLRSDESHLDFACKGNE
jgi:hypothetical protein